MNCKKILKDKTTSGDGRILFEWCKEFVEEVLDAAYRDNEVRKNTNIRKGKSMIDYPGVNIDARSSRNFWDCA